MLKEIEEFYEQRGNAPANNLSNELRENDAFKNHAHGAESVDDQDYAVIVLKKGTTDEIVTAYPVDSEFSRN